MSIASPKDALEYYHLSALLKNSADWRDTIIAGYRSEENEIDWVDFNNKINYGLDWYENEPDNAGSGDHCIGMVKLYFMDHLSNS